MTQEIIAIVSPPYEEAIDGGGIFKEGYVGNHSHSKNPDTVGNRTYSNKTHNFSDGQIGSLKSQSKEEPDFDITKYHKCLSDLYWFGCYDSDAHYKQYFEPSTYAHPAKISPLFAERIFKHLEQLRLLKEGMTVLDFMAGSGRVPLLASLRGYKSIGIELEPHFIKMCNDNKKFAENKIGRKLDMTIVQGDSRQLSKLLTSSDVAVLSPPYGLGEDIGHSGRPTQVVKDLQLQTRYGSSEGNIGNLPYVKNQEIFEHARKSSDFRHKDVIAVVSPPYQDAIQGNEKSLEELKNVADKYAKEHPNQRNIFMEAYLSKIDGSYKKNAFHNFVGGSYSQNPQNIGNLKDEGFHKGSAEYHGEQMKGVNLTKYSNNPDNIGNLKDTSFVGIISPPYENAISQHSENDNIEEVAKRQGWRLGQHSQVQIQNKYSDSAENLGNQQGENYLSAMLQVYKEASKVCPVICTITKNPTRQRKLRRLDLDTARLLELSGYKIVDYHRAVLFKTYEQQTLTGLTKKEYKGRLSFFKRLSLAKGNLASEWENILIGVKI